MVRAFSTYIGVERGEMHPENKLTLLWPEGINDRNEMVHWENNSAQYRSEERITRGWCLLQYKVQTGKGL